MRVAFYPLVVLAACSGDTALAVQAECNPLGVNHCMTPWPSSAFEVEDTTTSTGRHLALPEGTLPTSVGNIPIDSVGWNVADGFSPEAPIVMSFDGTVSDDGLPPRDHMELSLTPASPTVLLDMTTGLRVTHSAEIDQSDATPESQAIVLRPAQRLIGGHRYAAAITTLVKDRDGEDLAVPPGFAALRDGHHTDHALLEEMRPRFQDVLDALEVTGFPDTELVVAWDFTVASDDVLAGHSGRR